MSATSSGVKIPDPVWITLGWFVLYLWRVLWAIMFILFISYVVVGEPPIAELQTEGGCLCRPLRQDIDVNETRRGEREQRSCSQACLFARNAYLGAGLPPPPQAGRLKRKEMVDE